MTKLRKPKKLPDRAIHPVLLSLWSHAREVGAMHMTVADLAGVGRGTIDKWWFHGMGANIYLVEACLNVIGLTLTVKELNDGRSPRTFPEGKRPGRRAKTH